MHQTSYKHMIYVYTYNKQQQKNKHTKCDQEWGETGTLLHWWEYIYNSTIHLENRVSVTLKVKHTFLI